MYSNESWDAFMDKLRDLPYSKAKALRVLSANAVDCEPDAQGRILIPAKLRQYADLQRKWWSSAASTGLRSGVLTAGPVRRPWPSRRRLGAGYGRDGAVSYGI
ncbi:MAG: division/cell wall cluster transcriptional repressor MraZ [Oscillospiraceae bacterium]